MAAAAAAALTATALTARGTRREVRVKASLRQTVVAKRLHVVEHEAVEGGRWEVGVTMPCRASLWEVDAAVGEAVGAVGAVGEAGSLRRRAQAVAMRAAEAAEREVGHESGQH